MIFSKRSHEGYLMIDHRASPGISRELAIKMGLRPESVREGAMLETVTYGCEHCGTCYVKNPWRTRPREHCFKCSRDICDGCYAKAQHPDYVHKTFREAAEDAAVLRQLITEHHLSPPLVLQPKTKGT